jgi:hypothetical protein
MGAAGAGIFLVLAVVYGSLAIYIFSLVSWARLAALVFISVGLFFAVFGILGSLPHPDPLVLTWQLFVVGVDAWILWYLRTRLAKDAFGARLSHPGAHIEAPT